MVGRLKEASAVIADLDESIRSDAWDMLKPFVAGSTKPAQVNDGGSDPGDDKVPAALNETALVEEHTSDHDGHSNGLLVAAILYGTYGQGPYKPRDLTKVGEAHLLLLPRWNNFLPRAKVGDRKLFRKSSEGWIITTEGSKWLSATYGVKRGTQPKPE